MMFRDSDSSCGGSAVRGADLSGIPEVLRRSCFFKNICCYSGWNDSAYLYGNLAISTNIVISLGMVGALSIVRFRTAIKNPMDLLYLFWAIIRDYGRSRYVCH